jgi:hypothetical protein
MDYIKEFGDKVSIMDVEDGLQIINYNHCDNQSDDELKRVRGLVQEVATGKILFDSFPYTEEYEITQPALWKQSLGNSLDQWEVFHSLEGTLLRIFWYGNNWFISTNKKLNAFKSRWSSRKSFGDMFNDALFQLTKKENSLPYFYSKLDKNYVYFFLIRYNQENRVVCQVERDPSKQIVFIGRKPLEGFHPIEKNWVHSDIPIYTTEPLEGLTLDTLEQTLDNTDLSMYQGLILFHKTENRQIKLLKSEYKRLALIRGNNPNIRFRYLEIRLDPYLRKDFLDMYPLSQDLFLEYENILYQIAKLIRVYYIQRYIKNKYVTLPKEEYILMKKCHEWYLSNREDNRINVSKVLEILNQEDVLSIYKMIRRYQMNQTQPPDDITQDYQSFRMRMTSPILSSENLCV